MHLIALVTNFFDSTTLLSRKIPPITRGFPKKISQELNLFQNEMGRSRGMGHCLFQSPQEAQMAIQELRDVDVAGRPIWIAEDAKGGKGPLLAPGRSQPY